MTVSPTARRTALSDRIAHLNGQSLRHVIGQDSRAFGLLLVASLLQAAAQATLAPSMLSLAEAIALTWRTRLTSVVRTQTISIFGSYLSDVHLVHRVLAPSPLCPSLVSTTPSSCPVISSLKMPPR